MTLPPPVNGCLRHFLLIIQLNFRNPQGIVYGYLVPIIFLLAFGGVFRADDPPLLAQMGQILTITILGGACFGLPTALVAERERGIWQRYRLLPVATAWLIVSAMLARALIVASSVLVQLALARALFGTPFPIHPGAATLAFLFVTAAFLGIGFLIAALANNVPAVQALGQCIFLPMILIGGVGVPLAVLPVWAQRVAGCMPGRYAVEVLQPCFSAAEGLQGTGFRLAALMAIGLAAGIAGAKLFRWEAGRRMGSARWWVASALASWAAVGAIAWGTGRLKPVLPETAAWSNMTEAQIAEIRFDNLPSDRDIVAPIAPAASDLAAYRELAGKLAAWPQAKLDDAGQSIRNLVSIAAVADLAADPREAQLARLVFRQIRAGFEPAVARQALAWIILSPDDGRTVTKAPELGLFRHPPERLVRQRSVIYAQKFLGRLVEKIPE
jgi:ABC-type transport system involved in cytochrome c biogenesis permease component